MLIPSMLLTSLTMNVVALMLPFMLLKVFGQAEEEYSIPRTVQLMWQFKLYWVAVLILIFSIMFPFVKLSSLFVLWYRPLLASTRHRAFRILGSLGRWSLLDVFVALVLIVLSHDQSLFVTRTMPGLPLFLAAICLSIGTAELMAYLHVKSEPEAPMVRTEHVRAADDAGWRSIGVPLLLIGSLLSLFAALGLPYIRITAWYLKKNAYSVLETIAALWSDGRFVFALIVAVFLVLMPVLRLGGITLLWYRRIPPLRFRHIEEITRGIGLWAMLDVFGLALLLFLTEGSSIIKIEEASGMWAMLAAIVLSSLLGVIAGRVIRSQLAAIACQKLAPD
ncbi:MAG: paraquat-inducible protein A [Myxococcota bacterium]